MERGVDSPTCLRMATMAKQICGEGTAVGYHVANFWSWQIPPFLADIRFRWMERRVVGSRFTDEEIGAESHSRSRAHGYPGSCLCRELLPPGVSPTQHSRQRQWDAAGTPSDR